VNPTPQTILVVEDDQAIAGAIVARLQSEGFLTEVASDGLQAVELCLRRRPDLMVLDVMLPGIDGYEVCRRVQAVHPVPVLMLTARHDENDLLVGLGVGADDYLTKPFSPRELVARIRALLRRVERGAATPVAATVIRAGEVCLNPLDRRVTRAGAAVELTRTEFDLMVYLADRPQRVFTREQLLAAVWDWPDAGATRTVDSHVKALRRKLGAGIVRTVHGVGYAAGGTS
jgi:DNA-binding response OmpR family regulator